MLTNSGDLLRDYRSRGKCLPAFNIYNLETVQAALAASKATGMPVILAFGEGYLSHAGFDTIAVLVGQLAQSHPTPVVLHLDHCKSVAHIREAIDSGFTSVMYDGSRLPLSENIHYTCQVTAYAHSRGVTVEGELGGLNSEDGSGGEKAICFTDPAQAHSYVAATGIDSLAVSVGNAHGVYRGEPRLDWERMAQLGRVAGIPLVLHGCSGIARPDILRAAQLAVAKINVNTEIAMGAAGRIQAELAAGKTRYEQLTAAARDEMTAIMTDFLSLSQG